MTERPAGSGQMPLPIKLRGRLPKKRPHKNGKCPPHLEHTELRRLGLMRATHKGLFNSPLDFPLENHNPNSLLAAETSFAAEGQCCVVQRTNLNHESRQPGKHSCSRNAGSACTHSEWRLDERALPSKDTPPPMFSFTILPGHWLCELSPGSPS